MKCRDARERLNELVDGDLAATEARAVEEHVASCVACGDEARRLRRVLDALTRRRATSTAHVDVERNVAAIRAAIDTAASEYVRPRPWLRWSAAAAVLVAVGVAVVVMVRRDTSPDSRHATDVVDGSSHTSAPSPSSTAQSSGATMGSSEPKLSRPDDKESAVSVAHASNDAPKVLVDAREPVDSPANGAGTKSTAKSANSVANEEVSAPPAIEPVLGEPVDERRLANVRAAVAFQLEATEPRLAAGDVDAFVDEFDQGVERWRREGWPLVRIVERSVGGTNEATSIAAMRWLGRRGDAITARRIAGQLDVRGVREAAVQALIDMGNVGRESLSAALLDGDMRERVLDAVASKDPAGAVSMLERAVRASPRGLDVVTAMSEVSRRGLVAAVPWVESVAIASGPQDTVASQTATRTLAELGDVSALRALLRLRASARVDDGHVDAALTAMFLTSGDTALAVAREDSSSRRVVDDARALDELRQLSEAMQEAPVPNLVPAWLHLATVTSLGRADRRCAVLLVGELGSEEHVATLATFYKGCSRRERDLKAAALISIHALGGDKAAEAVLEGVSAKTRQRALSILVHAHTTKNPQTTLLELARELEPQLTPLQL